MKKPTFTVYFEFCDVNRHLKRHILFMSYCKLCYLFILLSVTVSCIRKDFTRFPRGPDCESLQESVEKVRAQFSAGKDDTLTLQQMLAEASPANGNVVFRLAAYEHLGALHLSNCHFAGAIDAHQKYLEYAKSVNDTLQILRALNSLAEDYRKACRMNDAVESYFSAYRLSSQTHCHHPLTVSERARTHYGIGFLFTKLGYPDEGLRFLETSCRMIKEMGDEGSALTESLLGIGYAYTQKEEYDSALVFLNRAAENAVKSNSRADLALSFYSLGRLAFARNDYTDAFSHLQYAHDTLQNTSDKLGRIEICILLARTCEELSRYSDAERLFHEALELAREVDLPYYLGTIYAELSDLCILGDRIDEGLQYHQLSRHYAGMIDDRRTLVNLMSVHLDFEREKSVRQLTELETSFQSRRHFMLMAFWVSVLIIVLLVALFVAWHRYSEKKQKKVEAQILFERMKSNFYMRITHEFLTLNHIIKGLSEKLKNRLPSDAGTDNNPEDLDVISRQSENLLFLVSEVLSVSKLQSEEKKPLVNGNIVPYLKYLHGCFEELAHAKNIAYVFADVADEIRMDYSQGQIRQIVDSLLSNSIKHCEPHNKIIFAVHTDEAGENCILKVTAVGKGVSSGDLPHIFETFDHAGSGKAAESGAGIGLAFTMLVVESLGGSIRVKSPHDDKTVFIVELPIRNEAKNAATPEVAKPLYSLESDEKENDGESRVGDTQKPLVLIAGDNKDMCFYLSSVLSETYHILMAGNDEEAITLTNEKAPDLIIVDSMMPDSDGSRLCRTLKESSFTGHIPVIVLTGKPSVEYRIRTIKSGADAILAKPFVEEELVANISQLLTSRTELRKKYGKLIVDIESNENLEDCDVDFIHKVTDIIYREIKNKFFFPQGLADEMCVTVTQLNRKIKAISGLSTSSYVLITRLNKAKKLLVSSHKPIGDIAMDCGFDDFAYFSKVFKKEFGITPSQYQRMPRNVS